MDIKETSISGFVDIGTKGKIWFGSSYETIDKMNKTFDYLKKNNVSVIWTLLEDNTIAQIEKKHFSVFHSPIADYSVPENKKDFIKDVLKIINLLNSGENIYIHCFGGHGRTGMAILSLMIMLHKDPKESLDIVKSIVFGPETQSQIEFSINLVLADQDYIPD